MKSPFPGMDPFIEGCGLWEDFHNHLIEKIYESVADSLPANYFVRTGERGYVVLQNEEGSKKHTFKPDVSVTSPRDDSHAEASIAVAEPTTEPESMLAQAFIEETFRETFVEVSEAKSENLVTCIEVLSPSNKRHHSEGWNVYLRKRQGLLVGRTANLIEIDLLRAGQRMPMIDPWPESPFTLLVARKNLAPRCMVWPAYCVSRIPSIPIPLLKPDPDLVLDLQPIIEGIYARARYHRSIDYGRPLVPPLTASEAAFLKASPS